MVYMRRITLTATRNEHVHVLRCSTDGGAYGEERDEGQEHRLASETGREISDKRYEGGGGDGVRAADPYKIGAVEMVNDSWERGWHGHLEAL